ncbi:hypothetical protein ACFL0V_01425 [Nanoarchaeota archaeon]
MRTIRPDKRHVLSAREAMAEVEGSINSSVDGFVVEEFDDHFMLHNVPLRGENSMVQISKEYLERGRQYKPVDWIRRMRTAEWVEENEAYDIMTAPMYAAIICELYKQSSSSSLRKVLHEDFVKGVATGTVIEYNRQEEAKICHYGRDKQTYDHGHIVTASSRLNESIAENVFGKELSELKDALEWLNGSVLVHTVSDMLDVQAPVVLSTRRMIHMTVSGGQRDYFARGMKYCRMDDI